MKASTQELRERIVAAVDRGVPREEVADVFGVGLSTIKRYLKQRRETGSVACVGYLRHPLTCPDCPMTKKPARRVFAEVDRIIHHVQWQYPFQGDESRNLIRKGQMCGVAKGDIPGQVTFIARNGPRPLTPPSRGRGESLAERPVAA